MKGAVEFFKKYGIDDAKQLISMGSGTCEIDDGVSFHTDDLKRLIESHELVKEHGSLERAKMYAESKYTAPEVVESMKQAIADVESCQ